MNKVLKWIALSALGILVVGIGVLMAGKCLGGSLSFAYNLSNREFLTDQDRKIVEKTIETDEFDDIIIDLSSTDVSIELGDKNEVYYKTVEYLEPTINCENGKLSIINNEENTTYFFSFYIPKESNIVNITVKENSLKNLDIDKSSGSLTIKDIDIKGNIGSSSGDIEIDNCQNGDELDVKISSGKFSLKDSSFSKLNKKQSSGDTKLENVKISEFINESTSGSSKIDNCEFEKFDSNATSGSIDIQDSSLGDIKVKNTSGRLNVNNSKVENAQLSITSGDLDMDIVGEQNDYNYDIKAISGNIYLEGNEIEDGFYHNNDSDKNIKIKTTSGNVNIEFIN